MQLRAARVAAASHHGLRSMLFNSQLFLVVFLPVALLLQDIVANKRALWIATLLVLSAVFYAYWQPPLLALLLASIIVNWAVAQLFGRRKNRLWLAVGIQRLRPLAQHSGNLPRCLAAACNHRAVAIDTER